MPEAVLALAVVNAGSSAAGGADVQAALDCLRTGAGRVEQLETRDADTVVEQVEAAVREHAPSIVAAVGGDGTVRAVAEGVARASGAFAGARNGATAPRMLVVPAGSGNSWYQALWGDTPGVRAVQSSLADPRVRRIDLIRLSELDRASLLGVNVGLVARVAQAVERMKRDGVDAGTVEERYWTAFGEVLQDLRPFAVRVTVDGRPLHEGIASMITVGGVRNFGQGRFRLLPRAVLDDGLLDVCVVAAQSAEEIAALAAVVGTGEHVGQPGVHYAQGATVSIERTDGQPLDVEHDGDPAPAGPTLTLEAVPAAVAMLAEGDSPSDRG